MNLGTRAVSEVLLPIVEQGGLDPVYQESLQQWLFDFWPNLTWGDTTDDVQAILEHPAWPKIEAFFTERYGFDLRGELLSEEEIDG